MSTQLSIHFSSQNSPSAPKFHEKSLADGEYLHCLRRDWVDPVISTTSLILTMSNSVAVNLKLSIFRVHQICNEYSREYEYE